MSVADNEDAEFWKKAHEDTCVLLAEAKEERNAAIERAEKAEAEQKRWEAVAEKAWEQAHRIGDNLFKANLLAMENETRIKTLEERARAVVRHRRREKVWMGKLASDIDALAAALDCADAQSNDDHQKD